MFPKTYPPKNAEIIAIATPPIINLLKVDFFIITLVSDVFSISSMSKNHYRLDNDVVYLGYLFMILYNCKAIITNFVIWKLNCIIHSFV